jgi:hypothetical protein
MKDCGVVRCIMWFRRTEKPITPDEPVASQTWQNCALRVARSNAGHYSTAVLKGIGREKENFEITRVAQKVMPHISFLGNYLFRMYEIHAQYNWMFPLHMLFFHMISSTSTALRQCETRARIPSLYHLVSCSRIYVREDMATRTGKEKGQWGITF